ncbi:MAG: flagellar motor protein MotB [Aliidongia sp.]
MMPFDDPETEPRRSMAPGWMITFADLLSLLLTFFVLVFATSTIEQKDWQRVVQPISAYLTGRTIAAPKVTTPTPAAARLDLAYVATLLERLVADVPALAGSHIARSDHAVVLTLKPGVSWIGGTAPPLADLARLLSGLDNRIEILVHAGADPSPHAEPVAEWRRALQRAVAIAAELTRLGDARPLAASGTVDLPSGAQPERIEIEIDDVAAEAPHAAP